MIREHLALDLAEARPGAAARLAGWVHRRRDHGGLIFIDLRDRSGLVQVVFDPKGDAQLHRQAEQLRSEFCVAVEGEVAPRPAGTENPKLPTGRVEVRARKLTILNPSPTPPFEIVEGAPLSEELRYTYRYLDLRREKPRRLMRLRHDIVQAMRRFLDQEQFLEIETPVLNKSTPEGARDFLVPSRLSPGKFYALPQSPQLFKQILMVAGAERYYQVARCFRDEDLRADRQPEFTQLDLELSFTDEEEIFSIMERLFAAIWQAVRGEKLPTPFPRLTYTEAMARYGTDKPDLRFGMELTELTELFRETGFKRFQEVIGAGGRVVGLAAPGGADFSRKDLDDLIQVAKSAGAGGLVPVQVTANGLVCPVLKHLGEEALQKAVAEARVPAGGLLLLAADRPRMAQAALGACRLELAKRLKLIPESGFRFLWVTEFPMFHYNEQEKRWEAEHHPFTAPFEADLPAMEKEPGKIRSRAYDLVINGVELGSGSIRIHRKETQEGVFRVLGIPEPEALDRFGFLLEAFRYGAPPHGGIAFGVDRLTALLGGADSIREVIPFPKTQKGIDLMVGSPTEVSSDQLKGLGLGLKKG
ncbi:MAG: aspartate--tRNA ligase [Candidatus Omnitrophica bacterium CG11_big_fil_rev_8_21_14_0_20_64_10]|nr:MAG: aspartate--tRNA ligase [Candidatus Omnitrophica bacterium CG11_big_fil_rev_8_21_14_0_20_64_10]